MLDARSYNAWNMAQTERTHAANCKWSYVRRLLRLPPLDHHRHHQFLSGLIAGIPSRHEKAFFLFVNNKCWTRHNGGFAAEIPLSSSSRSAFFLSSIFCFLRVAGWWVCDFVWVCGVEFSLNWILNNSSNESHFDIHKNVNRNAKWKLKTSSTQSVSTEKERKKPFVWEFTAFFVDVVRMPKWIFRSRAQLGELGDATNVAES